MIDEPGSFSGNQQFGETGARAARHQPNIVGNLVKRHSQGPQCAGQLHQRVVGALHRELVRRADERQPGQPGDLGCRRLGETRGGVDPGADRGAAERQPVDALERVAEPLRVVFEHAGIARPFLPQGDRRRILHVGAADLDDVPPRRRFGRDRVAQRADRGQQTLGHAECCGDVHRRRKGIVRRLRHVDIVVRVHRLFAPERRAGELAGAVGHDLVDVHVELGAAAGHPHMQRKHILVLAAEDLVGDLDDQAVDLAVEPAAGMIGVGRRLFQDGVGVDHLARDQILADAEMLKRALGLRPPQLVGRNLDLAEAVGLLAKLGHARSPVAADYTSVVVNESRPKRGGAPWRHLLSRRAQLSSNAAGGRAISAPTGARR